MASSLHAKRMWPSSFRLSGNKSRFFQKAAALARKGTAKRSWQNREYMPQQLAGPLTRISIPRRPKFRVTASEFSLPPRINTGVEVSSAGLAISDSIAGLLGNPRSRGIVSKNEDSGARCEEMLQDHFGNARAFPRLGDQIMMM